MKHAHLYNQDCKGRQLTKGNQLTKVSSLPKVSLLILNKKLV